MLFESIGFIPSFQEEISTCNVWSTKTPMSEFVQRPVEGQRKALERLTGRKIRVKKDGQNQARTFNYRWRYTIGRVTEETNSVWLGRHNYPRNVMAPFPQLEDVALRGLAEKKQDWFSSFRQSSNKSYASFSKLFSLKNEKCFTTIG